MPSLVKDLIKKGGATRYRGGVRWGRRWWLAALLSAVTAVASDGAEAPSAEATRQAVNRALTRLEVASRRSAEARRCYTCHHQGLAMLAFVEAAERGFKVDLANLNRQADHTLTHLRRGQRSYLEGLGQGGKADTAGSALWALESVGQPADKTTAAVVHFLLAWDDPNPYWTPQSWRPPSEGSRFTSTFLALRGMAAYGEPEQAERIALRRDAAREWLEETKPRDHEDAVFRLLALHEVGAGEAVIRLAATDLISRQREDGGWAQLFPDAEGESPAWAKHSDAYATATALFALLKVGRLATTDSVCRRGMAYLIREQKQDGSWHVPTRSRPVQEPYESGFPHGKDQFISSTATAWAVRAILGGLGEADIGERPIVLTP